MAVPGPGYDGTVVHFQEGGTFFNRPVEEVGERGCYRTTGFVNVTLPAGFTLNKDTLRVPLHPPSSSLPPVEGLCPGLRRGELQGLFGALSMSAELERGRETPSLRRLRLMVRTKLAMSLSKSRPLQHVLHEVPGGRGYGRSLPLRLRTDRPHHQGRTPTHLR